MTSRCI